VSAFTSRGFSHHADSKVTCPDCGRTFIHPHHAVVAKQSGTIRVQFKSKQTGRWGVLTVPVDEVVWGDKHGEAWDAYNRERGRR
jgi:hypothetical protein